MLVVKGAEHIRTMHQLKSFRALPNATGWPLNHIECQRIFREEFSLLVRQMRHSCRTSCWRQQQEKIRQRSYLLS